MAGGFHDGFGESRVGVHGAQDFVVGGFEFLGEDEFGDHFGGHDTDQVGAQEFTVLGVEDEFDEALGFIGGDSAAAGEEREATDTDFVTGFAGGSLGEAEAGDSGLGVGAAGNGRVVDWVGVTCRRESRRS